MKTHVITLALTLLLTSISGFSQTTIFEKYSDNPDVTYVNIKPKMFRMIAKMGVESTDAETQAYMDMVKSITSFKTIVTNNKAIASDILKWANSYGASLEELMEVKENSAEVKFYVQEGKDEDHVKELLIFVNGLNQQKASQNKGETPRAVIVSLKGDINLNEISKLTKRMNIVGGEHLKRKK